MVQDFLSVFAAGNEGLSGNASAGGAHTVTSPATAKNCITVGATLGAGQAAASSPQYVTHQAVVAQLGANNAAATQTFQVGLNPE